MWSKMYLSLLVKYLLFLFEVKGTWIFSTDFRKIIKYEIPWKFSSESRVPCRRTGRLTDIKLIVAFRDFANAPQNNDKNDIAFTNAVLLHRVITNCNF